MFDMAHAVMEAFPVASAQKLRILPQRERSPTTSSTGGGAKKPLPGAGSWRTSPACRSSPRERKPPASARPFHAVSDGQCGLCVGRGARCRYGHPLRAAPDRLPETNGSLLRAAEAGMPVMRVRVLFKAFGDGMLFLCVRSQGRVE